MSAIILTFLIYLECLSHIRGEPDCGPAYLTPHIKNGTRSVARELSKVDPSFTLGFPSYSGFITVVEEYKSNLFFWYFPHENVTTAPWIIWLNGGPGVSSLMGLFDMIGPIMIEDEEVIKRNVTWASDYSLLFIDSPVGAGFSFTEDDRGYTSNEDQVSEQLYSFLQQFLEVFPEQAEAPLFIAGESYAGKYVPAFALQIHRHRAQHTIKLKGISLGNAMIDPRNMMHYTEMARTLGLLDKKQLKELRAIEASMISQIDQGKMIAAANKFNQTIEYIKKNTGVSVYNFLEGPTHISSPLEEFVNKTEVRCKIHVGNASFDLNNQLVYEKMLPDIANSTRPMVEELLSSYGVMCYSGQLDLILPYSGSSRVFDVMQWPRKSEYEKASRTRLKHCTESGDEVIAYKKAGGNFVDILLRGCGHMATKEKPEVVKYIVELFINKFK